MSFTAKDVQALREKTGCGMMDCKKALTESNGDMEKAVEILREKGMAAAEKKASRIAAEGLVDAFVTDDGKTGVVVEVNSETDFVSKNADFQAFVREVGLTIAQNAPADVEVLLNMKSASSGMTVAELLREKIQTIGENMTIRRFHRAEGAVSTYVHGGGRIGVLTEFDAADNVAANPGFAEFAKDISMQIAAMSPMFLSKGTVPADELAKEREILFAQIKNDEKLKNKPEQVIQKMVEGRLGKYYEANCLLEQIFIKDGTITVAAHIAAKAKEFGGAVSVKSFTRFEKGEGMQKKEDNFAAEVANMVK